jgi:Glycosyl-4,4'-diaponeurosporenoate acyltransferase
MQRLHKQSATCAFFIQISYIAHIKPLTLQGYTDIRTRKKIKMRVELYNMIPNFFWSIICLFPIAWFCYYLLPQKLLYIFLGISFIGFFLPKSFYNIIQVKNVRVLKKTGVAIAQHYAQNGMIINRVIRKKIPGYKTVYDKKTMQVQLNKTYEFEKFHFAALLFFLLTTIFALIEAYYLWALGLTATNIVYNIYPILLQHYTRLRIMSLIKHRM